MDMDMDSDSTVEGEPHEQTQKAEYTTLLYDGSHLTILNFILRHGISKQVLTNLVSLVNVHLPQHARLAPFYKLKQFFEHHLDDMEACVHYYCAQ